MIDFNMDTSSLEALKKGYFYHEQEKQYECLLCHEKFEDGEIFCINHRYYEASRAVVHHIEQEHGNMFHTLIEAESKYNSITDKQKDLLTLINQGLSDQQIAAKLGISASTVRHQKFNFREKAKQAKMYLAIYDLAMEKSLIDKDPIIPIHEGATMVDDRYFVTEEENEKIIATVFESLKPLKLKLFSAKEKKKIVALRVIAKQFEKDKIYSEKEVNQILKDIYEQDYPMLRRYLIEYGYMERTKDCKEYWVKKS